MKFFITTFLLVHLLAFPQTETQRTTVRLDILAKFKVDQGSLHGFIVSLYKDTVLIQTTSGKSTCNFKLDYNQKYLFKLSKEDYITKTIEFRTTDIPIKIWNSGFDPYKMSMTIFKQPADKIIEYISPVCTISYNPNAEKFDYDTNYTKKETSR